VARSLIQAYRHDHPYKSDAHTVPGYAYDGSWQMVLPELMELFDRAGFECLVDRVDGFGRCSEPFRKFFAVAARELQRACF